jgi:NADPH:quinone reductase-like Zn-dependent oxidoreductase
MKAAVYRSYGPPDVVTASEMPRPAPRDGEILIRVHAATVGIMDSLARRGQPRYARIHFGLRRPRFGVLGSDFAGQVEAAGPAVTGFRPGDRVFGTVAPRFGAHAEYVCLSAQAAVPVTSAGTCCTSPNSSRRAPSSRSSTRATR